MRQSLTSLESMTQGPGLYEITGDIASWVREQGMADGLLTIFIRHTSASLVIQENADPDVCRDLQDFFANLVRNDPSLYRHTAEGPDDMPAHIKSALTQSQLSIPVQNGRLALGTWQGIYVFEHRDRPHRRTVALHLMGD